MSKIIRLTEADLTRIVRRVINEQMESGTVSLKVGDRVEVSNLDERPGYNTPSPNKIISFMGTVCKIAGFIVVKTDNGKCAEVLNKSQNIWKDERGNKRIYQSSLREPTPCDKFSCQK